MEAWRLLERILREAPIRPGAGPVYYRGMTNVPLVNIEQLVNTNLGDRDRHSDQQVPATGGKVDYHRELNPSGHPRWSVDPSLALVDASSESMRGRDRAMDPRGRVMEPARGQSLDPRSGRVQPGAGHEGYDVLIAAHIVPPVEPNGGQGVVDFPKLFDVIKRMRARGTKVPNPRILMVRLAYSPSHGSFEQRKSDLVRLMGVRGKV